jgi:hypothetical protein
MTNASYAWDADDVPWNTAATKTNIGSSTPGTPTSDTLIFDGFPSSVISGNIKIQIVWSARAAAYWSYADSFVWPAGAYGGLGSCAVVIDVSKDGGASYTTLNKIIVGNAPPSQVMTSLASPLTNGYTITKNTDSSLPVAAPANINLIKVKVSTYTVTPSGWPANSPIASSGIDLSIYDISVRGV